MLRQLLLVIAVFFYPIAAICGTIYSCWRMKILLTFVENNPVDPQIRLILLVLLIALTSILLLFLLWRVVYMLELIGGILLLTMLLVLAIRMWRRK